MTDLAKLTAANLTRWNAASITPSLIHTIDAVAHRLVAAKARYQIVSAKTDVPWAAIAVIHQRESSQSWAASLARVIPGAGPRSTCRTGRRFRRGKRRPRTR